MVITKMPDSKIPFGFAIRLGRVEFDLQHGGEDLQNVNTSSARMSSLKFWITFIFRSVEPKLSYYLHSEQNFRYIFLQMVSNQILP